MVNNKIPKHTQKFSIAMEKYHIESVITLISSVIVNIAYKIPESKNKSIQKMKCFIIVRQRLAIVRYYYD